MSNSTLPPINFPQMNDGVINDADLINNVIAFNIYPGSNATSGDSYLVYFDGQLQAYNFISSGEDPLQVWSDTIPANESDIPNGFYLANYCVTDSVGNLSFSPSELVIVDRDSGDNKYILPAPIFIDVNEQNTITEDSIEYLQGTRLRVNESEFVQPGDVVELTFCGYEGNSPQVSTKITLIASMEEEHVDFLVPSQYLMPLGQGRCSAFYTCNTLISDVANALVSVASLVYLLPPPFYDDINQFGFIPKNDLQKAGGASVTILYPQITIGDRVTFSWQGYDNFGNRVDLVQGTESLVVDSSLTLNTLIPIEQIEILNTGQLNCYYQVLDDELKNPISQVAIAKVNLEENRIHLPQPVFTSATGGELDIDDVIEAGSSNIMVKYDNMSVGDIIDLTMYGLDSSLTYVPDSTYNQLHQVTEEDVSLQAVFFAVPAIHFTSVEEDGVCHAFYTVEFNTSPLTFGLSRSATVTMIRDENTVEDNVDMQLSFGAAPIDSNTTSLTPHNQGKIIGPAGAEIFVATSSESIMIDNEEAFKTFILNEQGVARFSISSTVINPQFALTATYGVQQISRFSSIMTYKQESPNGFIYNVTTAAVADGAMVNSIYINRDKIDASFINARIIEEGSSAQFISAPGEQTHDFPFSNDGDVSIHIISTRVETVHILLSIDGGYANIIEMGFVSPTNILQL